MIVRYVRAVFVINITFLKKYKITAFIYCNSWLKRLCYISADVRIACHTSKSLANYSSECYTNKKTSAPIDQRQTLLSIKLIPSQVQFSMIGSVLQGLSLKSIGMQAFLRTGGKRMSSFEIIMIVLFVINMFINK